MVCLTIFVQALLISPVLSWATLRYCRSDNQFSVAEPAFSRHLKLLAKSKQSERNSRMQVKRNQQTTPSNVERIETWRVFGINIEPDLLALNSTTLKKGSSALPTISSGFCEYLTPPVLNALLSRLRIPNEGNFSTSHLPSQLLNVRVVRQSLDARKRNRGPRDQCGPRYSYVIDVDLKSTLVHNLRLRQQPGQLELRCPVPARDESTDELQVNKVNAKKRVVIVGAGPAGLFCGLQLARSGLVNPIIVERGKPVEFRGKDIGALMHRRSLDSESNFAFGEGGAGTWSDGKLTTRIGRNSEAVRHVLETLVGYGAPENILVDGAPHLGTDNLVRLLRNMRADLRRMGGEIRFGAKMTGLKVEKGKVTGVEVDFNPAVERTVAKDVHGRVLEGNQIEIVTADAVVLATGHSARDVYEELNRLGVKLEAKGFAVGFRVEHPQSLINKIQYGTEWGPRVFTGKVSTDSANANFFAQCMDDTTRQHTGKLPVPSYRLATAKANDGTSFRGVYSFCMCPGGQVVPASTNASEICVNGMSFSRRDSLWANSALVVTISPNDVLLEAYRAKHGVLAGLAFQREMELRAARLGGGNLTVPVQRLTDFLAGIPSTSAPPSSYRLGVKPTACHEIYPTPLVNALRDAVVNYFQPQMPGFISDDALLHAVETRTSSPVRVSRDPETLQAIGVQGLFPAGEGAGFAGGIVSAAVDGMVVAEGVLDLLAGNHGPAHSIILNKNSTSLGFDY